MTPISVVKPFAAAAAVGSLASALGAIPWEQLVEVLGVLLTWSGASAWLQKRARTRVRIEEYASLAADLVLLGVKHELIPHAEAVVTWRERFLGLAGAAGLNVTPKLEALAAQVWAQKSAAYASEAIPDQLAAVANRAEKIGALLDVLARPPTR